MKKKMINSQISNFKTYNMYFRRMLSLAENVFEFENLPKYIDVAFLNKTLLRQGAIAFFKDEVLGLIALPFAYVGKVDVYGRPTTIQVYGQNNYSRILKDDEYVIMYDNNGRYPLYLDICQMAERLSLCVRTEDINMIHQRTPRVWKTSKDKELSVKQVINEIDSMTEDVVTYESLDIDDMSVVLAPAPYVTDKIDDHIDKLWSDFYQLIGIASVQETKKERLIRDEMVASQGGTIAARFSRFEPRKNAIEKINEKFGENISVHYYDGEPDSEDKENDEDVANDVLDANDSANAETGE